MISQEALADTGEYARTAHNEASNMRNLIAVGF